jgi:hypothetical protein
MGTAVALGGSFVDRNEGSSDDAEFKMDAGDTAWLSAATAEVTPAAEALESLRSRKSTSPR